MKKKIFVTSDIFDNKNKDLRMLYFDACHATAHLCDMGHDCIIEDDIPTLTLCGTKWQMLKYYWKTLSYCDHKRDGIKRLLSFLFD